MPITDMTDAELIKGFVRDHSEAALQALTQRHVDLVFGTAFRKTSDRGAAEEITQNVFMILVRKAAWLQAEDSIASWLHKTALFESRQWWRGELRRRQREQTAIQLETTMTMADQSDPALAGALDEALMDLREAERQAVLLRFFEGKNHREIGAALGIGEDAARKRVDRAMDQLTAFFRKRGFAVGSAYAMVALIRGVSEAAPTHLSGAIVKSITVSGFSPANPILSRFLGLGHGPMVVLCVALVLPVVWQQVRLTAAKAEQTRLETLVKRIGGNGANPAIDTAHARLQLSDLSHQTNSLVFETGDLTNLDTRLFLWNEKVDYVRVPKSVLQRLGFGSSLETEPEKTFKDKTGQISPRLLGAIGLSAQEQARVQALVTEHVQSFNQWSETNGYLAEFNGLDASALSIFPNVKQFTSLAKLNADTRVWVTPSLGENGSKWPQEFLSDLVSVMGQERANLVLKKARNDGTLGECFNDFASKGSLLIVTPSPEGGFYFAHIREGVAGYSFNTPCAFSEALDITKSDFFDEAATRRDLEKRIEVRRKEFPNEPIPPIEDLVEQSRKDFATRQDIQFFTTKGRNNVLRHIYDRPLPLPLVNYLQQWRAAHPDAPDAPKTQTAK